jgi:hypothetical protein
MQSFLRSAAWRKCGEETYEMRLRKSKTKFSHADFMQRNGCLIDDLLTHIIRVTF